MPLVDEYRSVQDLREWVSRDGIEYVAYRLWDDEFYGQYEEEEIVEEISRLLGL